MHKSSSLYKKKKKRTNHHYFYTKKKTHVIMFHVAEKLDFPERPLGVDPVVKRIPNLLNRNSFFGLRIRSAANKSFKNQFN